MNTYKKKIVFLASGNGGNLHFIYEAIRRRYLEGFKIIEVIGDRECRALDIAKINNIKFSIINFNEPGQDSLLSHLKILNPDLIITTVHKILEKPIIQTFDKKLINLHYSLLPSFSGLIGMKPVELAIQSGSKRIGVTAHFAEILVDKGEHIAQINFSAKKYNEFSDEIRKLIFRCGCYCLLAAIYNQHSSNEIILNILGEKCILQGSNLPPKYKEISEDLWASIQHLSV